MTAILLHGFGAPGDDLVGLADALDRPSPGRRGAVRWLFPEAPLRLGGMYGDGRAWWPLDLAKLEAQLRQGANEALRREVPAGLAEARAQLLQFVDAVTERFSLTFDRIVLGGFSQGSMLALDVALHAMSSVAGAVVLSGAWVAEPEWLPLLPALAGIPVFQSHGRHDPVLPFTGAERLSNHLREAGADVEWHPFDGGHTIPMPVVAALSRFLHNRSEPAPTPR